jgi:hypothetical protein
MYFTLIYDQEPCKMLILAVVSIDETGQREVLAFNVGEGASYLGSALR